jgi:hypothetical protein
MDNIYPVLISGRIENIQTEGLLKNAHLLRCAKNRIAQRMPIYASRFDFLSALHLSIFEQPLNSEFLNRTADITYQADFFKSEILRNLLALSELIIRVYPLK